jgi:hypothetical protein
MMIWWSACLFCSALPYEFAGDVFFLCFQGARRLVVLVRQTLIPGYERNLHGILGVVSKYPSNPNFAQFSFEKISAMVRYCY